MDQKDKDENQNRNYEAIRETILTGRIIKTKFPEIKRLYREGASHKNIAEYLINKGFEQPYLTRAISRAIKGHKKGYEVKPYKGLIEDKRELEEISREHRINAGKKLYENRQGCHGLSIKELKAAAKKSREVYRENIATGRTVPAIFNLSRKSVLKAVKSRGFVPWETSYTPSGELEEDYAIRMTQSDKYQNKGRIQWTAIAGELNSLVHEGEEVRTRHSVCSKLRRTTIELEELITC